MLSNKVKYLVITLLACIMLIGITSPVAEAAETDSGSAGLTYQGGNSLTGGHTYSDLYASYIFSQSDSSVASEVSGSLSALSKYPTDAEDTGTGKNDNQAYGNMTKPFTQRDSQKKDVGKQTATLINTLYKYDYLVPSPRNADEKSVLSVFGNLIAGNGAAIDRSADSYLTKKSLDTASAGSSVYDFFSAATDKFSTMARNLDVTRILYNSDKKLTGDENNNGFIESTVVKTLDNAGLSATNIKTLQYFAYTLILVAAVMSLIVAMKSKNVKQKSGSLFKKHGLRILVIIMFLPAVYALNGIFDSLDDALTSKSQTSANDFNEQFVVDSLMFAATTNLNIGIANPTGELSAKDNYKPDEDFKPSGKRVKTLMDDVSSRAKSAGIQDNDVSAKSLISQISNQKKVDVNDYFGLIAQGSDVNSSQIAASTTPLYDNIDAGYTTGKAFSKDRNVNIKGGEGNLTRNPIFLTQNTNGEDKFGSTMEKSEYKNADTAKKGKKRVYYIPIDKKVGGKGKDKDKSLRSKASEDLGYALSYKMITRNPLPVSQNMPFKMGNVKPEEPATYIYGATPPGGLTKSNKEFSNYINGAKGIQNHNPVSGKEKIDDKQLQESMKINALRIALMNRYGGISSKPGVNTNSLSTQSTSFLLQTENPKSGVINYKGFNPVASDEGESKQTGKDGTGFVRYTIPNTGKGDLITKIGSINVTWLTSGVVATMAFIYLLMSPVFGSLVKQFKAAFATGFTGNFAAFFTYITYRVGLACSFLFAKAAVMMGVYFSTYLVSSFDIIGKIFGSKNFIPGSVASISTMVFTLVLCLVLIWPVAKISVGSKGKQKSVSVLGMLIIIPYMICENLEEFYDRLYARIYGTSQRNSFLKETTRGAKRVKQGQLLKNGAGKVAKGGATVGLAAATGGGSLLANAGKAALTHSAKHLGKGLSSMGDSGENAGPGIDIGKDGQKGNGFLNKISGIGQSMERYSDNKIQNSKDAKNIENDPYDLQGQDMEDARLNKFNQNDDQYSNDLDSNSFNDRDTDLESKISQSIGKDGEIIEHEGNSEIDSPELNADGLKSENAELKDPQLNDTQQDGLDEKMGITKDNNDTQDVKVANFDDQQNENDVSNDNSNNDDNMDKPLNAKLDDANQQNEMPKEVSINDEKSNIIPEGVTLDDNGNAVDQDGHKVELNDEQKVALENESIGIDGQGVDLNDSQGVDLNDSQGVDLNDDELNLRDNQGVDLNDDELNLRGDQKVGLDDEGVNLNDNQGVDLNNNDVDANLKDGQGVDLNNNDVNANLKDGQGVDLNDDNDDNVNANLKGDQGVELNKDQKVGLDNEGVELKGGQGVDLNNDNVNANLKDGQNVELNKDQKVNLDSDGVELKEGQTVDLRKGQGVDLNNNQKVNLDSDGVELKEGQTVDLNKGQTVDLNKGQGVDLNGNQKVGLNNDSVKAELKDGQGVDLNKGQSVNQSGSNVGPQSASIDTNSIHNVVNQLKNAGIQSTPSNDVLEKLTKNASFNKASHIKEAATQKVEIKQQEMKGIKEQLDKVSLSNAQSGIQNRNDPSFKSLEGQLKGLEREIGHQSQRIAGANSKIKAETREIKRESVIERTKETYANFKETKAVKGAEDIKTGVKNIVTGNDSEQSNLRNNKNGLSGGDSVDSRRKDRQNEEIIKNLRAIRNANRDNGNND